MIKKYLISKENFLIYLVSALPLAIVTGPFLPDLIVSVSSIFFVFYIFLKKKIEVLNNYFFKFFFIFWLYLVLNSLFSNNILFSLKTSIFYIRFGIFVMLVSFLCERYFFLKLFTKVFFFTMTVILLDCIFQFMTGKNIVGIPIAQEGTRLTSFFKDEYIVGSYLSRSFPLLVSLILILLQKKFNLFLLKILNIFFFIIPIVVFLSGERSSFFFIIFYILLLFFFLKDNLKFTRLILLISFLSIVTVTFVSKSVSNRMIIGFYKETGLNNIFHSKNFKTNLEAIEMERINKERPIYFFSKIHEGHILTAINIYKHNVIIGVGPNMFRYECNNDKYAVPPYNCTTHPHNFHAQLLSEIGTFGYLFIFFIFIYLVYLLFTAFLNKKVFKNKIFYNLSYISIIIGLIVTLQPFTTNGNFFNNWLSIFIYLPVGFLIFLKKKYDL